MKCLHLPLFGILDALYQENKRQDVYNKQPLHQHIILAFYYHDKHAGARISESVLRTETLSAGQNALISPRHLISKLSWMQMHDIIIVSSMFTRLNFNNQIHKVERKSKRKQAQSNILHLILSRSLGLFLAFLMKRCLRSSLALGLCN